MDLSCGGPCRLSSEWLCIPCTAPTRGPLPWPPQGFLFVLGGGGIRCSEGKDSQAWVRLVVMGIVELEVEAPGWTGLLLPGSLAPSSVRFWPLAAENPPPASRGCKASACLSALNLTLSCSAPATLPFFLLVLEQEKLILASETLH